MTFCSLSLFLCLFLFVWFVFVSVSDFACPTFDFSLVCLCLSVCVFACFQVCLSFKRSGSVVCLAFVEDGVGKGGGGGVRTV